VRLVFQQAGSDRVPWQGACFGFCVLLLILGTGRVHGQQFVGFRYEDGKCVNDEGDEGHNPGYVGECGGLRARDLRGANLITVDLSGADMHSVEAQGIKLEDGVLVGAQMTNAKFESADLRKADLTDAAQRKPPAC